RTLVERAQSFAGEYRRLSSIEKMAKYAVSTPLTRIAAKEGASQFSTDFLMGGIDATGAHLIHILQCGKQTPVDTMVIGANSSFPAHRLRSNYHKSMAMQEGLKL
ncbi:hypothetical protein PMAYCL1PPCAC_17666, partial [Pristionchus mayeri]